MINQNQLSLLLEKVKEAGQLARKIRKEGLLIELKNDGSKVTNADKELDKIIVDFLKNDLKVSDTIISEESIEENNLPKINKGENFWCLDPIDSTHSFVKGIQHYCISIAYISNNTPTIGIIYAPDVSLLWYGVVNQGCFKQFKNEPVKQIYAREVPKDGAVLLSSEKQTVKKDFLEKYNIRTEIKLPSAIKFTYIAEGKADFYTRERNIACDWDIAAGHALILAAGGHVSYSNNDQKFMYGQPPYQAPSMLARGKISI